MGTVIRGKQVCNQACRLCNGGGMTVTAQQEIFSFLREKSILTRKLSGKRRRRGLQTSVLSRRRRRRKREREKEREKERERGREEREGKGGRKEEEVENGNRPL